MLRPANFGGERGRGWGVERGAPRVECRDKEKEKAGLRAKLHWRGGNSERDLSKAASSGEAFEL